MKKLIIVVFIIVIAFVGYNYFLPQKPSRVIPDIANNERMEDAPLISVVAKNLEVPWALAFLPNKDILVTERAGSLKLIKNGQATTIAQIPDVLQTGESGLHGIVLHPNFSTNHFIYLYHTYSSSGDNTMNRVVRYKYEDSSLLDRKVIVDEIPGAVFHDGGRIKFGPDRFLYITTGDALNPSFAQDKNSLAGKVLRVTDEGQTAPGNPFGNRTYSYGHRNPQGIAWDNQGRLFETEHGNSATDELNLIIAGRNYGWPDIRGTEQKPGMQTPLAQSGQETWAPSGTAFLNNSIFFAGLRGQALFEAKINGDTAIINSHFKGELGRIREVIVGPDNFLYITTSNRDGRGNPQADDDKILRVNPDKL